jgi:hypothetical protein
LPQSAAQIETGIRAERFYTKHAVAAIGKRQLNRSIPRSYVRVYIERLRSALEGVLWEAGLLVDATAVVVGEKTVMNEVGYRLRANCEWIHLGAMTQPKIRPIVCMKT